MHHGTGVPPRLAVTAPLAGAAYGTSVAKPASALIPYRNWNWAAMIRRGPHHCPAVDVTEWTWPHGTGQTVVSPSDTWLGHAQSEPCHADHLIGRHGIPKPPPKTARFRQKWRGPRRRGQTAVVAVQAAVEK
jgi:hypothetical protein